MRVSNYENFAGRVNYAAQVISRRGTATRTFDACFENNDGDAVCAALARRAEKNAKIAANLDHYLSADIVEKCRQQYQGQNLTGVARQLRAEATIAHDEWMKKIQADRAATA